MEELWRFGIPINLRKTLWPFKIQNKLCISKQLYRLNKEQGLKLLQKAQSRPSNQDFLKTTNNLLEIIEE